MKKIIAAFLITATFASLAIAQDKKTEIRNLSPFDEVRNSGSLKVVLQQGNTESVKIETEEIELTDIITEVEKNELKVYLRSKGKGSWRSTRYKGKAIVYVTFKKIKGISNAGSGTIVGEGNFSGDNFEIKQSGSGNIRISRLTTTGKVDVAISGSGNLQIEGGTAKEIEAKISGSGNIDLGRFEGQNVQAKISGSGNILVNASQSLYAKISGSGNIGYRGNATNVEKTISGSGKIRLLSKSE